MVMMTGTAVLPAVLWVRRRNACGERSEWWRGRRRRRSVVTRAGSPSLDRATIRSTRRACGGDRERAALALARGCLLSPRPRLSLELSRNLARDGSRGASPDLSHLRLALFAPLSRVPPMIAALAGGRQDKHPAEPERRVQVHGHQVSHGMEWIHGHHQVSAALARHRRRARVALRRASLEPTSTPSISPSHSSTARHRRASLQPHHSTARVHRPSAPSRASWRRPRRFTRPSTATRACLSLCRLLIHDDDTTTTRRSRATIARDNCARVVARGRRLGMTPTPKERLEKFYKKHDEPEKLKEVRRPRATSFHVSRHVVVSS